MKYFACGQCTFENTAIPTNYVKSSEIFFNPPLPETGGGALWSWPPSVKNPQGNPAFLGDGTTGD